MKHLKKFENFYLAPDVDSDEQDYLDYAKKMREVKPGEEITNPPHAHEEEEEEEFAMNIEPMAHEEESEMRSMAHEEEEGEEGKHIMSFEAKNNSYKKSGLKNPKKADLNKDKKISEYEKKRGKAIEDSIAKKDGKGLTAAQKKLPEGLRKAIEAKKKK
jgi:hypothetical protein